MSEIAVVMATWIQTKEQEAWLREAIGSVRNQTFRDWELIVVDDHSPLEVKPAFEYFDAEYEAKVTHLRLPRHGGPATARNTGVAYTRAPWIFCLDCDDKLKPDALARLYAEREYTKFVYGDLEFIGDRQGFFRISAWNMDDLRKVVGPIGVTALQSRNLWRSLNGWREDLEGLEDIEYWIRAAECGITGKHLDGAIFDYRIHDDSRTTRMRARGTAKQMIEAVRQNHLHFLEPNGQRKEPRMGGKVEIVYVGRKQGGFPLPRSPLGKDYRVDGMAARFPIDSAEIDWILSFRENGQPMFRVFVPEPPPVPVVPVVPVVQPPPDFESLVVESTVPKINEMNAKQAAAAVMAVDNLIDLKLLASVENATQRRTTVEKAINARGKELQGDGWLDLHFED